MECLPIAMVVLLLSDYAQMRPLTSGYVPAQPCDQSKCELPTCRCASEAIPGGFQPTDTPQIITISFDDDLQQYDYETYFSKVFLNRSNPNGCPIGLTFFVSHNYTNYALVEDLYYTYGFEMADHSVTHREPTTWWEDASLVEWATEEADQRDILHMWGNIPQTAVRGFRSPFLVTSENEIRGLYQNNFTYEATMVTNTMYWPFTLDYKSPICQSPATCPNGSYPGLWLIPNIQYQQKNGVICSMIDACTYPQSEEDWLEFFMDNFYRHYNGSRAPFGIYAHSAWFWYGSARINSMTRFLDKIKEMSDVYVVTHWQLLQWVQRPTALSKISDFQPWQCPARPKPRCSYTAPSCEKQYGEYYFESCTTPCPPQYPHYGDPSGN